MRKEPLGLYLLRWMLGIGLLVTLSLIYWSTSLIEEEVKALRQDNAEMKSDIETIQAEVLQEQAPPLSTPPKESQAADSYPNLLHEDPFYETTLPRLLGKNFKPQGKLKTATVGRPDNLHPFTAWADVSSWYDLCTGAVAKMQFGIYETMAPDMAIKIEERKNDTTGTPEFWIFLRNDLYWLPLQPHWFPEGVNLAPQFFKKHPVTSADFKFYFDAMMNPDIQQPGATSLSPYYRDVEEFQIIDPYTFVVRWKVQKFPEGRSKIKYMAKELTGGLKPLPCHIYQYFSNGMKIIANPEEENYRTNPVWAQNFSQHWAQNVIVSCGAWSFDGMTDQKIAFRRNVDYEDPLAALTNGILIDFRNTPDNIWEQFKGNQLDIYHLQPDQIGEYESFLTTQDYLKQAKAGSAIKRLDYVSRMYHYIGWNAAKPYFNSAAVRRAMTLAIDRKRIVNTYLNGLGLEITGPFYIYSPAYDKSISPLPFDPDEASHLLEQEGWIDADGNGARSKVINGVEIPFRFTLTYYVKNQTLKAICEYIATALNEIHVDCELNGVDIADLSNLFEDKNFDAICLGWALGTPPEDPRQLWYSSGAKEKGSSNAVGFANAEADRLIDALDYESDPQKRQELYHRLDAILYAEQPYTFLYTPKTAMLYREYVQNVFIPADRQDLIPGANVGEPSAAIYWMKNRSKRER